ncbi:hypothetical protein [Clostridium kluyveri]|uniref:hypothetical protein n=1 Tax=Clostridium kluyveri TaxID=1534 RepID=UPI0022455743|nr:hypothetical protein [Clostridium kluyveri]UZQ52398.1 hypothetical protein OP486_09650 [Clostridium kluyveri]
MKIINSFEIDNKVEEKLEDLKNILKGHPFEDSYMITQQIVMFADLLKRTRKSLKSIFTSEELYLLFDTFNCTRYCSHMRAKDFILWEVSDVIDLEKLNIKWNVDSDILVNKIEKLTEFEAFTVITIINAFWNNASKYKDGNFSELFD